MYHYILPKKDDKGIGGAIIGGAGQFVNAYNLGPANQDNNMNPPAPPPAGNPPSVFPGSSTDSKSTNPPPAFRPKGRIDRPAVGQPKTSQVKAPVKSTATVKK